MTDLVERLIVKEDALAQLDSLLEGAVREAFTEGIMDTIAEVQSTARDWLHSQATEQEPKELADKLKEWAQQRYDSQDEYPVDDGLTELLFDAAKALYTHPVSEPLEMFLCEASAVVLKPQSYRFVVDPDCDLCKQVEIDGALIIKEPASDEPQA